MAAPRLPSDFATFAPRAGYQVEPDGRVYVVRDGKKSYIPPWVVWQSSDEGLLPEGGGLTQEGRAYRTPGSDPSSAWHFMYSQGGPFTKRSQWDDAAGTYEGSIDWGTLLGTIAAGGLIGAGLAGIGSGAAAVATPTATAPAAGIPVAAALPAAAIPAAGVPAAAAGAASAALAGMGGTAPVLAAVPLAATPPVTGGVFSGLLSGTGLLGLVKTGADVGTALYLDSQRRKAAEDAALLSTAGNDKQLAFLREQSALDQKNFESTQAENRRQFDTAQGLNLEQYNAREGRLTPYRNTGEAANSTLASLLGFAPAGGGRPVTAPSPPPTATALDPTDISAKITQSYVAAHPGQTIPQDLHDYYLEKALKPDLYSDGLWRQGWNDYLAARMNTGAASADVRLAGMEGVVGRQGARIANGTPSLPAGYGQLPAMTLNGLIAPRTAYPQPSLVPLTAALAPRV